MGGESRSVAGLTVTRMCVVRSCLTKIPVPRIFCGRHWSHVPERLQQEIGNAWLRNDREGLEALVSKAKNAVATAERRAQDT